MITWMKKPNIFQIAKVQPQGFTSYLLLVFFCQFQAGVAHKSVGYEKACIFK